MSRHDPHPGNVIGGQYLPAVRRHRGDVVLGQDGGVFARAFHSGMFYGVPIPVSPFQPLEHFAGLALGGGRHVMTPAKAVRLAVALIRAEVKRIAFDANLADRMHVTDSFAVRASQRRRELLAACDVLATLSHYTVNLMPGGASPKSGVVSGDRARD